MRICIIGGIFDKPDDYLEKVCTTPETTLVSGLQLNGHDVTAMGHQSTGPLAGFDVIHVHHVGRGALRVAANRERVPLVFTRHGWAGAGLLREAAARFVVNRSDAVVALSEAEAGVLRERVRIPPARLRVIPNGIDTDQFAYVPPPSPNDPWQLLYVGQLIREKGVHHLLDALALLARDYAIDLRVVHHTHCELEALRAQARALKLERVHFLGTMSPVELAKEYAGCHALVLPSYTEALPSAISEALMVGRPVIATKIAAIEEQVGDFGVVVPPRNPVALAEAIRRVLRQYSDFSARAEEHSRRAIDLWSVAAMIEGHERLYRQLSDSRICRHTFTKSIGTRVGRQVISLLPRPVDRAVRS